MNWNEIISKRTPVRTKDSTRSGYVADDYKSQVEEELTVRTLNCHYCKKRISITTVPDLIAFCDIDCAEKWKKGF